MKTSWQIKWHKWLLISAAILMLSMAGCGENDSNSDDDAAPTIPPAYTLAPDFSSMGGNRASSAAMDQVAPAEDLKLPNAEEGGTVIRNSCSTANYDYAAGQVGFWNTALWITLAVPAWSFAEAFNHDPVQQDDDSWIWSYDLTVFNVTYTAKLQGAFVDGEVHWHMYITKHGEYTDFLWYTGTSNLPATSGTWTLRKSYAEPYDWIGIEWNRSIVNQTWMVTYTNIHADDPNVGGFIQYGITGNDPYDAFFDICTAAENNCVIIESNTSTTAGRVKHDAFFGDDAWHLWDEDHCNSQP